MTAPRYKIYTLDDIALIPAEALPRFLAELPAILKGREEVLEAVPALAAAAKAKARWPFSLLPLSGFEAAIKRGLLQGGYWIDDDKGTITLTMAMKAGEEPFFRQTEKLP